MTAFEMPRKDTKLRLDDRIVAAYREYAEAQEISFNALIESVLFAYAKSIGKLPLDAQPLPETRGGARPRKKKKSEESNNEH
jgi:hypothetical protein